MQQLDSLWQEQGLGGPICFSWIDWLQNDALPFLGITERLLLTFTPRDPAPPQSFPEGPAAEAPGLALPAQRMQPDMRALAHSKAATDMEEGGSQAGQQLAGPANASQAGRAYSQSSRTSGASHQASDRQQSQHHHFQDSGSLIEGQAPQRDHQGRQTAHIYAAERSCNGQLGASKHRSRSQSNNGAPLNPNAHAWQPCSVQSCPQSESQAASEQGQVPGRMQTEQSQAGAAVPACEHLLQTLQIEQPALATGMAEAKQPQPASSRFGELEKPVPGTSTQRINLERVRLGSRAIESKQCLDPSCDMEQVAKLYTHLAAYSKMRDRELFKEVRQYHFIYGSA